MFSVYRGVLVEPPGGLFIQQKASCIKHINRRPYHHTAGSPYHHTAGSPYHSTAGRYHSTAGSPDHHRARSPDHHIRKQTPVPPIFKMIARFPLDTGPNFRLPMYGIRARHPAPRHHPACKYIGLQWLVNSPSSFDSRPSGPPTYIRGQCRSFSARGSEGH